MAKKPSKSILKEYIQLILKEFDWNQFSSSDTEDDNDPVVQTLNKMQADPEGQKAIAAQKQQKDQSHQDILTVNKVALAQKGINIAALKRLGQGAGGIAYAIDDKRVLKVTEDQAEASVANSIKGKNLKGIINIFDAWKFPNSNFYGVVMEKVIPFDQWPNDQLKHDLEEIVDTFNLKQLLQKYHGDWEKIWKDMSSSPLFKMAGDPANLKKAFETIAIVGNNLKAAGIQNFFDLHLGNIGKNTAGNVVVFDIGFAGGGSEPPVLGAN
jgi:hypothetical protein